LISIKRKTDSFRFLLKFVFFFCRSNHEIVMLIEQSFLCGSNLYIKHCNNLDSLLYPLAQWKCTTNEKSDDTNLIIYCGRRLYCHPTFSFFIQTEKDSLEKISSSLCLMTNTINCQYSVETLLDDLRIEIFQRIQPNFYQKKLAILRLIRICQQRIQQIDSFLKLNSLRFANRFELFFFFDLLILLLFQ